MDSKVDSMMDSIRGLAALQALRGPRDTTSPETTTAQLTPVQHG
jgi:hypothetical protein